MAVATDFQQLRSSLAVTQYDHDPDGTGAVDVAWVDMRDYNAILIAFFRTVGTSDLTFTVLANSASDGSGTDVTVKTKTISSQPDAVGDYVFEEVTAEEIAQSATDAGETGVRYVSANLTLATGTDEGVVTYIRRGIRNYRDQTADTVA